MGLPLDTAKKWLAARRGDIEPADQAFIKASVQAERATARNRQRLPLGLLFPVRPYIDVSAARAALGTHDLAPRHFGILRVLRHVDQPLVSARWVEAVGNKPLLAELAHVAERHRAPGGCLGFMPRLTHM